MKKLLIATALAVVVSAPVVVTAPADAAIRHHVTHRDTGWDCPGC